jgi:hypothetical protein
MSDRQCQVRDDRPRSNLFRETEIRAMIPS